MCRFLFAPDRPDLRVVDQAVWDRAAARLAELTADPDPDVRAAAAGRIWPALPPFIGL